MSSHHLLLESLRGFYQNSHYAEELRKILEGERGVSLRSIDWFITNYSKKNNVYYTIYKDIPTGNPTLSDKHSSFSSNVNVHQSYKAQLKSYSKKTFDPFCRRDRILFECKGISVETTIGQLNFFRWALGHMIIEYIEMNKSEIEKDMNYCLKKLKENHHKNGSRKKREQLSVSATRGLSKTNMNVEIIFE